MTKPEEPVQRDEDGDSDRLGRLVLQGLGGKGLSRPASEGLRSVGVPGAVRRLHRGEQFVLPPADAGDERVLGPAHPRPLRLHRESLGTPHPRPRPFHRRRCAPLCRGPLSAPGRGEARGAALPVPLVLQGRAGRARPHPPLRRRPPRLGSLGHRTAPFILAPGARLPPRSRAELLQHRPAQVVDRDYRHADRHGSGRLYPVPRPQRESLVRQGIGPRREVRLSLQPRGAPGLGGGDPRDGGREALRHPEQPFPREGDGERLHADARAWQGARAAARHAPGGLSRRAAVIVARSCYSFLVGTSFPGALVARAVELKMKWLALADDDSLAGAVPFWTACRSAGIRPVLGARVGKKVWLIRNRTGYANLCRLISARKLHRAHTDTAGLIPVDRVTDATFATKDEWRIH